ncbi:TfuA-like protein [Streptomyces sp. NBC_00239]|uniref:TfuA-like protein n=1 Tax=Streptomyces sp. NBC_00239 TaxID=2903640 RepID=UPI002E2AFAAD|nr:TfuA-like protein [Streptomyces sp. NBC_00239]
MTPRRIAFVGPTLAPPDRPRTGFTFLPPIRHGDLFALDLRAGDQVLVVDGVYQHFAPIRHKEILAMLDRGVDVVGTASLGALRAAELAGFGMRGLGHVYAAARSGELVADADVGVLHAGEDDGGRRLTVATVAVRHAAARLVAAGELSPADAAAVERVADDLHFTERSEQALLHYAGDCRAAMTSVLGHIHAHGDVKAQDALAALAALDAETLADAHTSPDAQDRTHTHVAQPVWESSYGAEWAFERRPLRPGSAVTERTALACLQLFAADFPARHLRYALHTAARTTGLPHTADAAALLGAAGYAPATRPDARLAVPTPDTGAWSGEERLLARTFRLRPGRLVYADLPGEALAGTTRAELEQWCLKLAAPADRPPVSAAQCHAVLRRLWQARGPQEYRLSALERGFRDEAEAARYAGGFDLSLVARLAERTAA